MGHTFSIMRQKRPASDVAGLVRWTVLDCLRAVTQALSHGAESSRHFPAVNAFVVQRRQTSAAESRIRSGRLSARVELVPYPICRKPTNLRVSLGAGAARVTRSIDQLSLSIASKVLDWR